MEYAEESLFNLKNKFVIFKEKEIVEILRQLLHGLGYMHKSGYIHADIKIENIMIRNVLFFAYDRVESKSVILDMPPDFLNKGPLIRTKLWELWNICPHNMCRALIVEHIGTFGPWESCVTNYGLARIPSSS